MGRAIVIGRSMSAYVAAIESAPDSGVDITNEDTAPLLAPSRLSAAAIGITPQEHNGSGTPIAAAQKTEPSFRRPNNLTTARAGMKARTRLARKKPANIYGAASPSNSHVDANMSRTMPTKDAILKP